MPITPILHREQCDAVLARPSWRLAHMLRYSVCRASHTIRRGHSASGLTQRPGRRQPSLACTSRASATLRGSSVALTDRISSMSVSRLFSRSCRPVAPWRSRAAKSAWAPRGAAGFVRGAPGILRRQTPAKSFYITQIITYRLEPSGFRNAPPQGQLAVETESMLGLTASTLFSYRPYMDFSEGFDL